MVSVGCFILLLIYQSTTVRPDGIVLPVTVSSCKSIPTEHSALLLSFTPNNDSPTLYNTRIPVSIKSIEDGSPKMNIPAVPRPEATVCKTYKEIHTQEFPNSAATKVPLNIVSIAAPGIPILDNNSKLNTLNPVQIQTVNSNIVVTPTIDNRIQTLNSNIVQTPQISPLPQMNLTNSERDVIVNGEIKADPPLVVTGVPSYFIINKDANSGITKTPLSPIKLDSLPNNIYKVKVNDAQPIFIDCSKSASYMVPATNMPTKIKEQVVKSSIVPGNQVFQYFEESNPSFRVTENFITPQISPINIMEKKQTLQTSNPNMLTSQQNTNTILMNSDKITKSETLNKVVCPVSNFIFNYGPNIFSQSPTANIENSSCYPNPPLIEPLDNKIGLSITPVMNFVPNATHSSQCSKKSSDFQNANNYVKSLSDSVYCCSASSSSPSLINQAGLTVKEPIEREPITQLPSTYTNSRFLSSPSLPQLPNIYKKSEITTNLARTQIPSSNVETLYQSTDSFSSRLSYSLDNIISALTAGVLSKLFDNTPSTSDVTTPSAESLETNPNDPINIKESDIYQDTQTRIKSPEYILNSVITPYPIDSLAPNSLPSIGLPVTLPSPNVQIRKDCFTRDNTILPITYTEKTSPPIPYLSSVTINILPTESPNDIIIVL